MALKIGTKAPDFTLRSSSGSNFTLSIDQIGKPLVIFFYPKDFTRGCTQEACDFRDSYNLIKQSGLDIVGISKDPVEVHQKFIDTYKLPYQLLADQDGEVARLYLARMPLIGLTKRITYVLDEKHIIRAVTDNLFEAGLHIKEVVANLN